MQTAIFRTGQQELVKQRVDSGTVIEIGDMVFLDTNDVKPVSDFTWDTNEATTQAGVANVFLGIAVEKSASGETDDISVDVSSMSVWEFTVASSTYEYGDELSPKKHASENELLNDTLKATASDGAAMAQAAQYASSAVTRLKVKFASAFNVASSNSNAAVG
ncbi:MAG: hypothetical protein IT428_15235 [Planctomycetaceae bacterium]|nr:hypothetical protein [Planctomycetaceae bacterium]